ncbi:MAG: hypothetical protein PUE64_01750 [Firmicutes bacterium]|nr:hypothetical protein [Bacillota bacterium]
MAYKAAIERGHRYYVVIDGITVRETARTVSMRYGVYAGQARGTEGYINIPLSKAGVPQLTAILDGMDTDEWGTNKANILHYINASAGIVPLTGEETQEQAMHMLAISLLILEKEAGQYIYMMVYRTDGQYHLSVVRDPATVKKSA